MFGSMIEEAAGRFDLGDKAGTLLSALLALMTNKKRGGLAGFLSRFREVGLGDTADSWINSGANTPLSYEQLESALGEETLQNISGQVGLEYEKTVFASAYMIPHIIDQISPEGIIPQDDRLLSRIGSYLTEEDDLTAIEPSDGGRTGTGEKEELEKGAGFESGENTILNWLLPLILLGFLLITGYMFCGGRPEAVEPAKTNVNSKTNK